MKDWEKNMVMDSFVVGKHGRKVKNWNQFHPRNYLGNQLKQKPMSLMFSLISSASYLSLRGIKASLES